MNSILYFRLIVCIFSCAFFTVTMPESSTATSLDSQLNLGADALKIEIAPTQHQAIKVMIGVVGTHSELDQLAGILEKDLHFTGQCQVTIERFSKEPNSLVIKSIYEKNKTSLALFIANEGVPGEQAFTWRMYDTMHALMLDGKKYHKRGNCVRGWAHNIADLVWPLLTGDQGFFSSRIAYCKTDKKKHRINTNSIYIADYDGSNEQLLVHVPTVNVAPRWNADKQNPLLFYSEHTNTNVRLMMVDMHRKRRIASNYDGINMLPSFSADGKKMVYCLSRGDGSCQLYYHDQETFKKLTMNEGNNVSPSISDDGSIIYFCSDYPTGKPQIYSYTLADQKIERITDGGYCATPCYHHKKNKVVYSKMMAGQMQLFLYDCATKSHMQLTFDAGSKQECAWSPCGNFVVYSTEKKFESKIALLNIRTKTSVDLTSAKEYCTYPAWSPVYSVYPEVVSA